MTMIILLTMGNQWEWQEDFLLFHDFQQWGKRFQSVEKKKEIKRKDTPTMAVKSTLEFNFLLLILFIIIKF